MMHGSETVKKWRVVTMIGTVTVWADSEAQARSRGKWKAVHAGFTFRNRAEELSAVRDCDVLEVKQLF